MESSKKFTLNSQDLKKVGIGAGVAMSGALLTYLTSVIGDIDFGTWTPIAVSVFSILANIARKWLAGQPL